jgi:N-acyl homoserine lactone hydrolase
MKLFLFELATLQPYGIPVPGYLIQTDEGKNILIDTGLPERFIENPPSVPGFTIKMRAQDYIVQRLATIGLTPSDINQVIITHFDADHAGNLAPFYHAEMIVQRRQYEAAKAGNPRFAGVRDQWDNPAIRYRFVDGDTTVALGIELVETSGHAPGHQSVLVRLPETGPVLLAIDAIADANLLDPETRAMALNDDNEAELRASTRKLVDLASREHVALLIHGHDATQWPTLKQAPEYYA